MPIVRPPTPRTELYNAVSDSNQRTFLINIGSKFHGVTSELLDRTQQKYTDFKPTLRTLLDDYNPDTLKDGLIYDEAGNTVEFFEDEPVVSSTFRIVESSDDENAEFAHQEYTESPDEVKNSDLKKLYSKVNSILDDPKIYSDFRREQNNNIELYTVDGNKEGMKELDGQRGLRFKRDLPKNTLVDIVGGQIKTTERIFLLEENISPFYDYLKISPKKYNFGNTGSDKFTGGFSIDGQSIIKMINSSNEDKEKNNINLFTLYYDTSGEVTVPIYTFITSKNVKRGEQALHNYPI